MPPNLPDPKEIDKALKEYEAQKAASNLPVESNKEIYSALEELKAKEESEPKPEEKIVTLNSAGGIMGFALKMASGDESKAKLILLLMIIIMLAASGYFIFFYGKPAKHQPPSSGQQKETGNILPH